MSPAEYFTDDIEDEEVNKAYLKGIQDAIAEFKVIIMACPFYISYDAGNWIVETLNNI